MTAVVKWLQQFLRKESNRARLGYALAIAGHLVIAVLLMLGAFERIDPASAVAVVAMPVDIVMERPDAQQPDAPQPDAPASSSPATSPAPASNEQAAAPSVPPVADADKRAKAPLSKLDVNGIDRPKQVGHDGSDRSSDLAAIPAPSAESELSSDAVSIYRDMVVAPIGAAQPQTTTSEPGEDELTAIKEEKLECGRKAKVPARTQAIRNRVRVLGFYTEAQGLVLIRSTQVTVDRHINPHYLGNQQILAETLEGVKGNVVLPAGFTVNKGDVIDIDLGHIDPSDPCHYIPNIAISKR